MSFITSYLYEFQDKSSGIWRWPTNGAYQFIASLKIVQLHWRSAAIAQISSLSPHAQLTPAMG